MEKKLIETSENVRAYESLQEEPNNIVLVNLPAAIRKQILDIVKKHNDSVFS